MQTLTIYQNTPDGLQTAGPEHGPEAARLARLKASQELEQKTILQAMQDGAVRHKERGNAAMEKLEYRAAVKEYNEALRHAHAMMDFLEVDKQQDLNGYQLRALARGQQLPKRGPAALDPFRALVHSNRSLAFLRLDAYDRALADAAEACRLLPQYLKAWVRRAAALAAANRREDALAVLDEALSCACPDTATKEQVCKLIVNVRALGDVDVRPPERDLPIVLKPQREVVKVPRGMRESALLWRDRAEEEGAVMVEGGDGADRRRLEAHLRAHWYPTHVGGRWRQTPEELVVVLGLPRRPKASELLVQVRLEHVWVLLRKLDAAGDGGREDYETVCDAKLCRTVKPSDTTWSLEGDAQPELVVCLQKQNAGVSVEGSDGISPLLWDRAFAEDTPLDLAALGEAAGATGGAQGGGIAPLAPP